MSVEVDSTLWRDLGGYIWGLLLIPLKMLWSKADNAASKEDLAKAIRSAEAGATDARETMRLLFSNAEKDRQDNNLRFSQMQERLHSIHVELLGKGVR